jgi:DNA-directed RNA polymerase subunit RPC12/RpoP
MPACLACGGPLLRKPRNLFNKIIDRAIYRCENCELRIHRRRTFFALLSYAECPKCGTRDLARLSGTDRIDSITRNPVRRLLRLFGCPLYHCTFCRFQFADWRMREADRSRKSSDLAA